MKTPKNYRIRIGIISLAIILIFVISNNNHKSIDSLSSLEQIAQMEDTAD